MKKKSKKKVLATGKPLSPKLGMKRVIIDGVLRYKPRWWLYFLPKFIIRIVAKYDGVDL